MPPPDTICSVAASNAFSTRGQSITRAINTQMSAWSVSSAKRIFDVIVVLVLSPIVAPLLLIIAAAVRLSSPGPVFFRQTRIGCCGTPFTIFKFRTMLQSTSGRQSVVAMAAAEHITPIGRFLRRFKLDELPQCINVLYGEMSLVGPRPKIAEHQVGFFSCRPGMTGAATLAFANEEESLAQVPMPFLADYYREHILPAKFKLDSDYMARATVLSDLRILIRTALRRWSAHTVAPNAPAAFPATRLSPGFLALPPDLPDQQLSGFQEHQG